MIACRIKNRCTQKGYTLIELLLVVTVLAFIASLGVKTYRDKAASDRINIAALNIQHVLEAGISYNLANQSKWPKKNWSGSNCFAAPADTVFVQNYLPNESNLSNLGVPICWNGDDTAAGTAGEQKAKRFWVAVSTGDSGDATAVSIAQRIAARLPNAIITNDPNAEPTSVPSSVCTSGACYVKAVVAMPAAGGGNLGASYVAGVGNCDSNIDALTGSVQNKQPGSGVNVYCRRTTLSEQFCTNSKKGCGDTELNSLSQYEIGFQCKPGEYATIYVVPNFVRMDRYSGSTGSPSNTVTVDPVYELSGAPETNPYAGKPPYWVDYTKDYCPTGPLPDGAAKCQVTMVGTYGYQNGGALVTNGCTTHMQNDLQVCTCVPVRNSGGVISGGCADAAGGRSGAVGASYIAMCNQSSPASANLAVKQTGKNFW